MRKNTREIREITELVAAMESFHNTVKAKEEDLKEWLPYDVSSFCYSVNRAIRDFKESALKKIAEAYIKENLPNSGLTGEQICRELTPEDQDSFNVATLLEKLKRHNNKATEKSLEHIRTVARRLIPYRYNKQHEWGPPESPKEIRQGKILRIRAYTWNSDLRDLSHHAYTAFEEIAALDKLCQVVLGEADPLTVESAAAKYLESLRRNDGQIYGCKHSINYFEVEFFKNGNAKLVFVSDRAAWKIAKELVGA